MEKIRGEVKRILGESPKRKRAYDYVKLLDDELGQYLTGLALFIGIQFVEYTLLFLIIGHPNWLLLGVLAALTTVIPYFGGLITNIVAVILASVVSTQLFIATLLICLIFPNIDGYIISPKIYGRTNNVNAMWTIFAVVAGGTLFGIPGIMISLPAYILLNCTYKFFKKDIYGVVKDMTDDKKDKDKKSKGN
jgi:predicted PurR-regulated permease PerM